MGGMMNQMGQPSTDTSQATSQEQQTNPFQRLINAAENQAAPGGGYGSVGQTAQAGNTNGNNFGAVGQIASSLMKMFQSPAQQVSPEDALNASQSQINQLGSTVQNPFTKNYLSNYNQ